MQNYNWSKKKFSIYKKGKPKVGQWKWHDKCPKKNLIKPHKNYRDFI